MGCSSSARCRCGVLTVLPDERTSSSRLSSGIETSPVFRLDIPGGTPGKVLVSGGSEDGPTSSPSQGMQGWEFEGDPLDALLVAAKQLRDAGGVIGFVQCYPAEQRYSVSGTIEIADRVGSWGITFDRRQWAPIVVDSSAGGPKFAEPPPLVTGPLTIGPECPASVADALEE